MNPTSKRNILIGLTVIVSICLLYWGIEYLKGINLLKPANYYYAKFEKVEGLTVASPVKVNGFKVGQVREINFDYATNQISVELSFEKDLKIPDGSTITFSNELLGAAVLQLNLGASKTYMPVGATIPTSRQLGLMDKVGTDMMPAVSSILPKVDSIVGSVNMLLANPALNASVTRFDAITRELSASAAELSALMAGLNKSVPGMLNNASGVMANANSLTSDLKTTTANLNEFTGNLNQLPLDTTLNRINATLANVQRLTAQLNSENSSLGQLLNDKKLYQNAVSTVASLDSLLQDVKKNPKKYVTIKVF
ncbi:MAG: MlaD family protein [Bacteroidales bacterium]|nr:MlaD family protein [Bacteroidales bacterium]